MPHKIIHNAIPLALCRAAEAAWPPTDWPHWYRYCGPNADKLASVDRLRIPAACIAALDSMALVMADHIGEAFVDYDLHGAGLHSIPPGGFVGRHQDADIHPMRPWRRTHSAVMFLNAFWPEQWSGELYIDGEDMITPRHGSCVIFETSQCWHGVRHTSGNSETRKTLALFAWRQSHDRTGNTSAQFESETPRA